MKTFIGKDVTGNIYKISCNKQKRTFTIRVNNITYRTTPMDKEEFNSCLHSTGNDWNYYLKISNDYYVVR